MLEQKIDFVVSSIKINNTSKSITLKPDNMSLTVSPSACVSVGDHIKLEKGKSWIICKNGLCQILPPYAEYDVLKIGSSNIELLIKEITEQEEYDAVQSLAEYHYRGAKLHGRTSCIVVRTNNPFYPHIIGYVELATPFYMNKARARVLNAPFSSNGISWDHWDKEATRKYIHLMVRIARCVVYPEFRGIGLGQILAKHAAEFSKNRWQSSGYLPLFIEISADMLKYVPFVEKAGMIYIGETEGNLGRVYRDMDYLTKNYERVKSGQIVSQRSLGIVDQQVARMDRTLALMKSQNLTREDILKKLKKLSKDDVLRDFALFYNIVSLPKPSYMMGLNRAAESFLEKRKDTIRVKDREASSSSTIEGLTKPIRLENISLSFISSVRRTKLTHSIQQSFGISPENINSVVIRNLSLEINPGEIVLIVGSSGSGKTTLLDFLAAGPEELKKVNVEGKGVWPNNYKHGVLKAPRSHKALIELMKVSDVNRALNLMGLVGLSDAYVYLKRFDELSRGQQYRAMLAMMMGGKYNVWLVDEFCANLDPITAKVISEKLKHLAHKLGITVIAASPHYSNFLPSLAPDKVVMLTTAWEFKIFKGPDFIAKHQATNIEKTKVLRLRLKPEFFDIVRSGQKKSTIRRGIKEVEIGPLLLQGKGESQLVEVTKVSFKRFKELAYEDAKK